MAPVCTIPVELRNLTPLELQIMGWDTLEIAASRKPPAEEHEIYNEIGRQRGAVEYLRPRTVRAI